METKKLYIHEERLNGDTSCAYKLQEMLISADAEWECQ